MNKLDAFIAHKMIGKSESSANKDMEDETFSDDFEGESQETYQIGQAVDPAQIVLETQEEDVADS